MGVSPRLRRVLQRRLRHLERVLGGRERQLQAGGLDRSLSDSLGEISRYDQHTADLGSETFERGKDIALLDRVRQRVQQVRRALGRMEQGSYGLCESCGAFVGLGRLLAVPYASRCARCQAREDRGSPQGPAGWRRPLEEAVVGTPFSLGSTLHGPEDPGLTPDDVWELVARHGTANSPQDVPGAVDYDETWEGADTTERGGTQEVEWIADVTGSGVVDPDRVYPDPAGPGRRRPRSPHEP